ncbi:TPA: hypothetical protein QDA89_002693 [Burkholderia vietnamiensis]|uniref:hypothetical protein n=1 Tax=Burkholderia vietnamiensis TaxID=60552 RepID=UPI002653890C|nr:hypothetical protein [Burkholderia vietnamiensis]MDN8074399.1 hypothetical protein [Burkholderia vietnamiensis]HDR8983775.1 hypothetical protein [Burkholderia vietnamiensis]
MDIAYFIASIFSAGISLGYFPTKVGTTIPIWFVIVVTIAYGLIGSFIGGKASDKTYRTKYWIGMVVMFVIPPLIVISWLRIQ